MSWAGILEFFKGISFILECWAFFKSSMSFFGKMGGKHNEFQGHLSDRLYELEHQLKECQNEDARKEILEEIEKTWHWKGSPKTAFMYHVEKNKRKNSMLVSKSPNKKFAK